VRRQQTQNASRDTAITGPPPKSFVRDLRYHVKAPCRPAVSLRGSIAGLSQPSNTPAGPTKRTKHANSKTIPQQLPSRVPITYTTSPQVCGINILDLSSRGLNLCPDGLDITASKAATLKYRRLRACRFTPTTYKPKGPEPPQLTSLSAQPTRETSTPFSPAQRDAADAPATLASSIRFTRVWTTKQATALISHSSRVTASATR
jgi:hypothetical protein